ncbi:MAG: HAD family hydrolase [Mogibacterium sp.]|nr:HAD family hydrolase [Mogibacterium sp.]
MIIFDLDGTLWDSTKPVADSWNLVIEKETGEADKLTPEDIMGEMGRTMTQIADDLFGFLSEEERYELAHKCEVFENDYIKEHGAKLFAGVKETLEKLLDAGEKMAVVSNCQEGYVAAFIESMQMDRFFCDYEEWGRTGLSKADNIRLVMERNGEDEAVYVGDIQRDADSAHEAGVPCIWAKYGFGQIDDAEAEIDNFDELPSVLAEIGYK